MLSGLFSFQGRYRILHLTWVAFFLTFICWFNFAPLATTIGKEFGLTPEQIKTLGICNLALTIPARIVIGMLLDRFGPRIIYSSLLIFSTVPCLVTAISQNFHQLVISRLLMGIVGAGFVVGIRMVAEWFPPQEIGIAQGIYGGWGNFGAFGAEFTLPIIALAGGFWIEGGSNWRGAITSTYPFMNLIARPSGGLLCERSGSRKWTLTLLATGIGICYLIAFCLRRMTLKA
jgi:NNP family nitrate/nitrite transporter-like MFS transporter